MYGSNLMTAHWSSAHEGVFENLYLPLCSGKPLGKQKYKTTNKIKE